MCTQPGTPSGVALFDHLARQLDQLSGRHRWWLNLLQGPGGAGVSDTDADPAGGSSNSNSNSSIDHAMATPEWRLRQARLLIASERVRRMGTTLGAVL